MEKIKIPKFSFSLQEPKRRAAIASSTTSSRATSAVGPTSWMPLLTTYIYGLYAKARVLYTECCATPFAGSHRRISEMDERERELRAIPANVRGLDMPNAADNCIVELILRRWPPSGQHRRDVFFTAEHSIPYSNRRNDTGNTRPPLPLLESLEYLTKFNEISRLTRIMLLPLPRERRKSMYTYIYIKAWVYMYDINARKPEPTLLCTREEQKSRLSGAFADAAAAAVAATNRITNVETRLAGRATNVRLRAYIPTQHTRKIFFGDLKVIQKPEKNSAHQIWARAIEDLKNYRQARKIERRKKSRGSEQRGEKIDDFLSGHASKGLYKGFEMPNKSKFLLKFLNTSAFAIMTSIFENSNVIECERSV
ncbi:unnamed protein product, partial [Trichogramma brassicae]